MNNTCWFEKKEEAFFFLKKKKNNNCKNFNYLQDLLAFN